MKIAPLICFRSLILSCLATVYINFWVFNNTLKMTEDEKINAASLTMVPFGLGNMFGVIFYGFVQDKCGSKAALILLLAELIVFESMIIVLNELNTFNWSAYLCMFGLGSVDNTVTTYITQFLGFEFESKIIPFAAKNFVENMSMFLILGSLSIWDLDSKENYRIFFITVLVTGIITISLQFTMNFKYNDPK